MIESIGFKNIRVFKDLQTFDIKPLTIFTGTNNSGKSSIQKMLMLLSSGLEYKNGRSIIEILEFKKDFIEKVGDFASNVNYTSDEKEIIFHFSFNDKLFGDLEAELVYEGNETGVIANLNKISIYSKGENILEFFTTNTKDWWKKVAESFPDHDLSSTLDEVSKLDDFANFWHINQEYVDKYIDYLYDTLIKKRHHGIQQMRLDELSIKYKEKFSEGNFSVEILKGGELETYNYFKEKGIIIGHPDIVTLMDMLDSEEMYSGPIWRVWDEDNEPNHIYQKDDIAIKLVSEFPSDVEHPFLIHTKLLSIIESDYLKFIKSKQDDKEKILKQLNKQGVTDIDETTKLYKEIQTILLEKENIRIQLLTMGLTDFEKFSEEYIKFEKLFIKKEMSEFEVNQKFEDIYPYGGNEHKRYSLDEIINKKSDSISRNYSFFYDSELFKDNIIVKILLNNKITETGGMSIPMSFFENMNRTVKKDSKKNNNDKVDYQHECARSLYEFFISPLFSFTKELGAFLNNVDIYLNNTSVKRHYIFGQSDVIDSPLLDFGDKYLRGETKNFEFVNKWLKEFGLADELIVNKIHTSGGNSKSIIGFYFTIKKGKDGIEISMSDSGLGVHQVLLLLVKLAMVKQGKTLLLEEPESNLHPALQSKLADLFVEASKKLGVKFLIETHSEYLIREMQYLIASKQLDKETLSINYLFDPVTLEEDEDQVKVIDVLEDGRLAGQFGSGFFDESSKLMMKTMKASLKN